MICNLKSMRQIKKYLNIYVLTVFHYINSNVIDRHPTNDRKRLRTLLLISNIATIFSKLKAVITYHGTTDITYN